MKAAKKFQTFAAKATDVKESEVVNGDIISIFDNDEEYFYTLISDGMGSGRDAALTSRVASVFLEKLLSGGNNKAVALEMLNNFIRCKNMESFATIDLLEIDMLSGQASFIKSGAAPSYIMRNGSLFKIASNSMPVGITREINAEEIKFELQEGDIIVMISDGVAQSFEDSIWLANMLTFDWEEGEGLQSMSEKILSGAKLNNKRSDDMTVGLIKIIAA
jgi:stage II sporulation protein E